MNKTRFRDEQVIGSPKEADAMLNSGKLKDLLAKSLGAHRIARICCSPTGLPCDEPALHVPYHRC